MPVTADRPAPYATPSAIIDLISGSAAADCHRRSRLKSYRGLEFPRRSSRALFSHCRRLI